jgi:hypothetical protein
MKKWNRYCTGVLFFWGLMNCVAQAGVPKIDGVWCGQGELLSLHSADSALQNMGKRCLELKVLSSSQEMGVGHWIGQWYFNEEVAEARGAGDVITVGVFAYSRDDSGRLRLRMLPLLDNGMRADVVLDVQGKMRVLMYRYPVDMRVHQAGVASMVMDRDGDLMSGFDERWKEKYQKTLSGLQDVTA